MAGQQFLMMVRPDRSESLVGLLRAWRDDFDKKDKPISAQVVRKLEHGQKHVTLGWVQAVLTKREADFLVEIGRGVDVGAYIRRLTT